MKFLLVYCTPVLGVGLKIIPRFTSVSVLKRKADPPESFLYSFSTPPSSSPSPPENIVRDLTNRHTVTAYQIINCISICKHKFKQKAPSPVSVYLVSSLLSPSVLKHSCSSFASTSVAPTIVFPFTHISES